MIDVKKLITGFLVLATAAVCSGVVFSFVNLSPSIAANPAPQVTITGSETPSTDNTNAFLPTQDQVDQVAAELAPDLASSTMMVSSTDPNNLTDQLAAEFVNGVVSANPDGPSGTDDNGNPTFTPPDVNALAAGIADSTTTAALQVPNWDVEAASIPVATTSSNPTALTNYGDALNDVLNNHLNGNAQVQSILSDQADSPTQGEFDYIGSQMQGAIQDDASLEVPTAAVPYQKALLTELVYEKNMVQLNDLAQTDPVKASLIFEQEDQKFSSVQENLMNQAQDLESQYLSLQQVPGQKGNIVLSFINNTFGIPRANALLPVFDPATWGLIEANQAQDIANELENLLKNTLLQILKNTLIAIIQREVLTWVQGSGAPRFITNWGTQLVNAAQQSAINIINGQIKNCSVYSAFIPQVKITLNAFYKPASGGSCANQFQAALGAYNFQQFYNNFANGGFVAFGASQLPSGNPLASQFFSSQAVSFAYNNQQKASQAKTNASNGLTGDEYCPAFPGADPINGTHIECESPDANDYVQPTGGSCQAGYTATTEDNGGLCPDGSQPLTKTPAAATGIAFSAAVGSTPQQTAAANDIVGILNSVLSSLLTSLASTAVNAAGQLVNQGLTNLNASNITSGVNTSGITSSTVTTTSNNNNPPPTQLPLACNPTSQTIPSSAAAGPTATSTAPTTVSATGGTLDANENQPIYYWSDSNGVTSTGALFSDTFTNPGTYTITLTDSTNDTPANCTVTVQP